MSEAIKIPLYACAFLALIMVLIPATTLAFSFLFELVNALQPSVRAFARSLV